MRSWLLTGAFYLHHVLFALVLTTIVCPEQVISRLVRDETIRPKIEPDRPRLSQLQSLSCLVHFGRVNARLKRVASRSRHRLQGQIRVEPNCSELKLTVRWSFSPYIYVLSIHAARVASLHRMMMRVIVNWAANLLLGQRGVARTTTIDSLSPLYFCLYSIPISLYFYLFLSLFSLFLCSPLSLAFFFLNLSLFLFVFLVYFK